MRIKKIYVLCKFILFFLGRRPTSGWPGCEGTGPGPPTPATAAAATAVYVHRRGASELRGEQLEGIVEEKENVAALNRQVAGFVF